MNLMFKWLKLLFFLIVLAVICIGLGTFFLYRHYYPQLPDVTKLSDVEYQLPLRIYSSEGELLSQFGDQKRIPVSISDIPVDLIHAFLAAEDDRFYQHPGVDYQGLLRAALVFARTGKKKQGGSTITMQVARNYLLSSERTFDRKIKEIFLSLEIDKNFSKQEILELYLNKIYLGHHAYGIGAAAYTYFGKQVSELSLDQVAILAGLPKAPSTDNPVTNPARAKQRRDYVLRRMRELGFISDQQYQQALGQPVISKIHYEQKQSLAPFMAEMVRQIMIEWYGEETYQKGFQVYTTIHTGLQKQAETSVRSALHHYSERHGYSGPVAHVEHFTADDTASWDQALTTVKSYQGLVSALVVKVNKLSIQTYTGDNSLQTIPWQGLKWAAKRNRNGTLSKQPSRASQIVATGDLIYIRQEKHNDWKLAQLPEVEGALVALNPVNGAILALQGGFDFKKSKFNRVTQMQRQPGSGFKPIIYLTALEKGFTAASIVNDAPIVFDANQTGDEWRPENFSHKFAGPTRLRVGLRTSRNLVSIRLLRDIGIKAVRNKAMQFGLPEDQLPGSLTLALGSGAASPLQMARVFAAFANGGYLIDPYFIDRIESADGELLFQSDPKTVCTGCQQQAPRIFAEDVHYIMHSMLQDVVNNGTARRAKSLGRSDLAGKTGTTNDQRDAWFNGYSRAMVATAWVGFDSSKPLGPRETGSLAALPMWIEFMKSALKGKPEQTFSKPDNIEDVEIDPDTGLLASEFATKTIREIFRSQNKPVDYAVSASKTTTDSEEKHDELESLF